MNTEESLTQLITDLEDKLFINEFELLILNDKRFSNVDIDKINPWTLKLLKSRYRHFGIDEFFKKMLENVISNNKNKIDDIYPNNENQVNDIYPKSQKQIIDINSKEYRKKVRELKRRLFL